VVLPSGRALPTAVRAEPGDGTLTLECPPGTLSAGAAVELRWAAEGRWWCLGCRVQEPDAGCLRLRGEGKPARQRDRRSASRSETLALVEVTVLSAVDVMPGTRLREWLADVGARGLAFDTELGLTAGDRLRVDVLPEGSGAIAAGQARVVRSQRPPGALALRVAVVLDDPPKALSTLVRRR
jgi:hypothetical protein